MKFIHLHTHSHYSLLDGLAKIDDFISRVKELGMDAVAITDHGNLYGAIEFYKEANKQGIKPILGVEIYVAPKSRFDRSGKKDDDRYFHLTLLAENETGWKNLIQLTTKANLEGFYYKPRVDKELLKEFHEGIIALSGCPGGEIPQAIINDDFEKAIGLAEEYQNIFGKNNFFLEIGHHPNIPEIAKASEGIKKLYEKIKIPIVATQDIHYLKSEDAQYHDILLAVQTGNQLSDDDRLTLKADDFSMRSPEQMAEFFKDLPEAIENTVKIAERCNVKLTLNQILLPSFPLEEGTTANQYLEKLLKERLPQRYPNPDQKVKERLKYELNVIEKTKFADYFLIAQDFVNWAKEHGIVVGPGRGSAAGSLVSYILGITDIDPLKYDLLFERFLNPERIAMPDIDIDFADNRRDEVFAYVREKYGEDRVAQIITFGTMAARASVRDATRAMALPYALGDQIAKLIPFGLEIEEALKNVKELNDLYKSNPDAQKALDAAKHLEGVARHASVHACGVVISRDPLTNWVPLQYAPQNQNIIITQFEMYKIEDIGLLKMDFLGLKNLTIIEETLRQIKEMKGENIDISKIPLDDKKTFELFQKGDTVSVFQFESEGMRHYLKELKPTEFEDIIAMVSLYRPGPMELIPHYIKRKHGQEEVIYLHPKLEPILNKTYGICLAGDSKIQTANSGSIRRIDELVNSSQHFTVQTFNGEKFTKKEVIRKFDNGIKDVYEITLRTGKKIKATKNHLFLTINGWRRLKDLKIGDFLATPKKLFIGKKKFNKDKLKILAYLIADGALTNKGSCYFVNKNNRLLKDFKNAAEASFKNLKIVFTKHIHNVTRATPIKVNNIGSLYHRPNAILVWLRELGLKNELGGKSSAEKFIPSFVFEFNEARISLFLAVFWDCDGGISKKMAYITTISERLSYDIQTLLLKLGINSFIYKQEKYESRNKKMMQSYRICVYDLNVFTEKIGRLMLTSKKKTLENIKCDFSCNEFVPRKLFFQKLANYLKINSISQREFCRLYKINRSNIWGRQNKNRNRLNIKIAKKIANILKDKELNNIFKENIRWEDIVSIHYIGKESVYDIEIKEAHNFIANNIIAHNCIYQEQVMKIAQNLASFSLAEADVLRKAIGKKIKALLLSQREKFIEGIEKNNIKKEIGLQLWEWIEPFASYSFNRSHAACYALIAYQTAYLKVHYPIEFMTSLFNADSGDVERIAFLISEAKKAGITVLPPDINKSYVNFVPEENNIRFGLLAVKNVGKAVVEAIIEERLIGGEFQNFADFIRRVLHKDLNKKSLESLIKAGVFDAFKEERGMLLANIDNILSYGQTIKKSALSSQNSLFGGHITNGFLKLEPAEAATNKEKLTWEKELIGLYISEHPLKQYMQRLLISKVRAISDIKKNKNISGIFRIAGVIAKIQKIITKNGQSMIFAKIEDLGDGMEVLVFSDTLNKNPALWKENNVVIIEGKLSWRDEEPKLIAQSAVEL